MQVGSVASANDCWDSLRIDDDSQIGITYAGIPLQSCTRYHWRVRVWNGSGEEGPWSTPTWFETAFRDQNGLAAPWIGTIPNGDGERSELTAAQWIWSDDPAMTQAKALHLRTEIELPEGVPIYSGRLLHLAQGRKDA